MSSQLKNRKGGNNGQGGGGGVEMTSQNRNKNRPTAQASQPSGAKNDVPPSPSQSVDPEQQAASDAWKLEKFNVAQSRFVFLRLISFAFFYAFLSALQHAEYELGCKGIAAIPWVLGRHAMYWAQWAGMGIGFTVTVCNSSCFEAYNGLMLRVCFALMSGIYAVYNSFGHEELFSRDYDSFLIECGVLAAILASPDPAKFKFTRQVLTFALFRFVFTYGAQLLYSECAVFWDLSFFLHSYKVPEPLPFAWHFAFYNLEGLSRYLTLLQFVCWFLLAPLMVMLGGLDMESVLQRDSCIKYVLLSSFMYFCVVQNSAWLICLLLALGWGVSTNCLIFPTRFTANWGADIDPEKKMPQPTQSYSITAMACVFLTLATCAVIGFGTAWIIDDVFSSTAKLRDYFLFPIFVLTCIMHLIRIAQLSKDRNPTVFVLCVVYMGLALAGFTSLSYGPTGGKLQLYPTMKDWGDYFYEEIPEDHDEDFEELSDDAADYWGKVDRSKREGTHIARESNMKYSYLFDEQGALFNLGGFPVSYGKDMFCPNPKKTSRQTITFQGIASSKPSTDHHYRTSEVRSGATKEEMENAMKSKRKPMSWTSEILQRIPDSEEDRPSVFFPYSHRLQWALQRWANIPNQPVKFPDWLAGFAKSAIRKEPQMWTYIDVMIKDFKNIYSTPTPPTNVREHLTNQTQALANMPFYLQMWKTSWVIETDTRSNRWWTRVGFNPYGKAVDTRKAIPGTYDETCEDFDGGDFWWFGRNWRAQMSYWITLFLLVKWFILGSCSRPPKVKKDKKKRQ